MLDLSGGVTLLSHLGMSGRWLFYPGDPDGTLIHVHVKFTFADGSKLWFQDPRRFGLLRAVDTTKLKDDPALSLLGPDPLASPLDGEFFASRAKGLKVAVKNFLLDQNRVAGIGNIYASEILHRAGVDPRRPARAVPKEAWDRIAKETALVLGEAVARMGTTFSAYRTLWNEPGLYGDQLLVYDRAGEACRRCGTLIRRIVQGQRSTFFCPHCQSRARSKTAAV
jgi:formamidopyrimidine-DNA glycosylase